MTGGAGFVGSHLIDELMKSNESVICLDNFCTGSLENIKSWIGNPNFQLIEHDVINPISLDVDKIWHLACPASPKHYQDNPIRTAKTNFLGTINMLGIAKKTNARLLFASTSEIYGNPDVHPQHENYNGSVNPNEIRGCYKEGKRIAESLCYDYQRIHNTEVRIARIFNSYGPRMLPNDGRVVCNFIFQSLNNQPLTIYGNGSQTRSFCYISDLIQGLIKLMSSNYSKPINLGSNQEISILELSNLILKKINSDPGICYMPEIQDDPKRRKPDITLAKKELKWMPLIDIDQGLNNTINYFIKMYM